MSKERRISILQLVELNNLRSTKLKLKTQHPNNQSLTSPYPNMHNEWLAGLQKLHTFLVLSWQNKLPMESNLQVCRRYVKSELNYITKQMTIFLQSLKKGVNVWRYWTNDNIITVLEERKWQEGFWFQDLSEPLQTFLVMVLETDFHSHHTMQPANKRPRSEPARDDAPDDFFAMDFNDIIDEEPCNEESWQHQHEAEDIRIANILGEWSWENHHRRDSGMMKRKGRG